MGVVYIPTNGPYIEAKWGMEHNGGMVHLPTWMARIDGKLVGKYTSPIEHLGSGKQKGSWLFKLYIYTQEVQRPKFAHW